MDGLRIQKVETFVVLIPDGHNAALFRECHLAGIRLNSVFGDPQILSRR